MVTAGGAISRLSMASASGGRSRDGFNTAGQSGCEQEGTSRAISYKHAAPISSVHQPLLPKKIEKSTISRNELRKPRGANVPGAVDSFAKANDGCV